MVQNIARKFNAGSKAQERFRRETTERRAAYAILRRTQRNVRLKSKALTMAEIMCPAPCVINRFQPTSIELNIFCNVQPGSTNFRLGEFMLSSYSNGNVALYSASS